MTEPRMVTVTIHETRDIEIPEPDWCIDPHGGANYFTDLTHNGREIAARFDGRLGTVHYLTAWISHAPYLERQSEPLPVIAVEVDGDAVSMTPDQVREFTATTREHLDALDRLAAEAERICGEAP